VNTSYLSWGELLCKSTTDETIESRHCALCLRSDVALVCVSLEHPRPHAERRNRVSNPAARVIDGPFRAMVRDAKTFDGLELGDPFAVLEWPEAPREKPDPFTEPERDTILRYFRRKASEGKILLSDYAFLYTLFWSGMRPSETIALRWADVDLRAETAEITKSRHLGAEAAPKTRGSHRTVRLLPTVVELLSFIKPLHANENDYVFHDTMEKPLDAAQWRKRHWNKAPKS